MDAELVGLHQDTSLVLGKHSGRHAFRSRLQVGTIPRTVLSACLPKRLVGALYSSSLLLLGPIYNLPVADRPNLSMCGAVEGGGGWSDAS